MKQKREGSLFSYLFSHLYLTSGELGPVIYNSESSILCFPQFFSSYTGKRGAGVTIGVVQPARLPPNKLSHFLLLCNDPFPQITGLS